MNPSQEFWKLNPDYELFDLYELPQLPRSDGVFVILASAKGDSAEQVLFVDDSRGAGGLIGTIESLVRSRSAIRHVGGDRVAVRIIQRENGEEAYQFMLRIGREARVVREAHPPLMR